MFSSVKTKANPNFAVKLAGRSNHSFLLSIWWITFSNTCTLNTWYMGCIIELDWLCKHMKNIRSSQPSILDLNWIKHSFSLWASLKNGFPDIIFQKEKVHFQANEKIRFKNIYQGVSKLKKKWKTIEKLVLESLNTCRRF